MIEKAIRIGLANLLLVGVKVLVGPFVDPEQEPEALPTYDAERAKFKVVQ